MSGSSRREKKAGSASALAANGQRRAYLPAHVRRQQIIAAAQEVFSRLGLKGAGTREIARVAGVNQSMIFDLFASKEELFIAAVVQPLIALLDGIAERAGVYESAVGVDELLEIARTTSKQHLQSMDAIFPLLVQALFSDKELGRKVYQEHLFPLIEARGRAMSKMIRRELDPVLVNQVIFGAFFSVLMHKHFTEAKGVLARAAEQVPELVLFGSFPVQERLGSAAKKPKRAPRKAAVK